MYKILIIIVVSLFCACQQNSDTKRNKVADLPKNEINKDFQTILDSNQVTGAILIFDESQNTYYSNDFAYAKKGFLPASTFKIPNSLIALETGVVQDTSTIMEWDGVERSISIWNEDMIFRNAFHRSCVPCYQDIARRVGVDTMRHYLNLLEYKNMQVQAENIDLFWLVGEARISPFEQIDFLQKYYHEQLPLKQRTYDLAKKMMLVKNTPAYKMLAKTGRTFEDNNSWYVGYVEKADKVYYFAVNFTPKGEFEFGSRKKVTAAALGQLKISEKD